MDRSLKVFGILIASVALAMAASPAYAVHTAIPSRVSPTIVTANTTENVAGVLRAVKSNPSNTCVSVGNSASSVARGIARIGLYTCQSGCWSVWAYTGTTWGLLGQCTQDIVVYPTTLPSTVHVCRGYVNTILRAKPTLSSKGVGSISSTARLRVDQVRLQLRGTSRLDGLAWYRTVWNGRTAWVPSSNVVSTGAGCSQWKAYWSFTRHR